MFALLRLLSFDSRPQLADLPDANLWRIDLAAYYGARRRRPGRIDLAASACCTVPRQP